MLVEWLEAWAQNQNPILRADHDATQGYKDLQIMKWLTQAVDDVKVKPQRILKP